ncbi:EVI2B protein, partial [Turnix velox]|nr:EVI2B protein [Turnix velox]
MAKHHLTLLLFYGEIWRSLSTAAPHNVSTNIENTNSSISRTKAEKPPLPSLQAPQSPGPAAAPTPAQLPPADWEPSDGSWVAGVLIGVVLVGMLVAILIILLWKCRRRPHLTDSNWAGRSPFADGDTPDLLGDPDQVTKRSSILFMLPWKWKQDSTLEQDPAAAETPAHLPAGHTNSPVLPAASHSPELSTPTTQPHSCPQPEAPMEPPDLPPPLEWDPSSDGTNHQELSPDTEEPLPPPPPELLLEEPEESPARAAEL